MDNIKIEFLGYGVELIIGKLNDIQSNYILTHQVECNTNIPIIDQNNQLTYKNWKEVNDFGLIYGASYGSSCQVNILVNDETFTLSNMIETRDYVLKEENSNYLMSLQHLNGVIFKYEFDVENFDETKLDFLIKDINCLLWGELIYGVKYDNQLLSSVYESYVNYYFENILIKNDLVLPIQKL
jgi:hypothetical protein